jgi:acyl-coenzyme A thioesterase PaaI-like protein
LAPDEFQSTLEKVSCHRPVRPGRLIGRGPVVHRDGDLAFLDASLADPAGQTVATATATARVIPLGVDAP